MINVPSQQTREWKQPNVSDLFGNLFVTKNLTFDSLGYLALSNSPRAVMADSPTTLAIAITFNDSYSYFTAMNGIAPYSVATKPLSAAPTVIATSGVPTTDSKTGVTYFGQLMVVSQKNDVDYYSSGTWTDTDITLTDNGQHQVVQLLSLNALAIANVNTIKLYASPLTATPNLITTLTIPSDFKITQVIYFNQNLYIGTQSVVGGQAAMYVWNGQGTAAQQVYQVNSHSIISLCAHKDNIYVLLANGGLMRFNGGGFDLAAAFPIYYTDMSLVDINQIEMFKAVMTSNEFVMYINFTNIRNTPNSLTYQPDGVWCYDENVGLYHRYAPTVSEGVFDNILMSDVNTTTNIIVVSAAPVTGTEMFYQVVSGSALLPLVNNTKYYVIKVDATHIQVASTLANALAGTAIDLLTAGNDNQIFAFYPNIDYGQFFAGDTGVVYPMEVPTADRQYGTDILWGGAVNDRTNSQVFSVMTASTQLESRGYFITPKIFSTEVTDNFNLFTIKFLPLMSEHDKIIIKTRTVDDMRNIIAINAGNWAITWTSSTTFTVTTPAAQWATAQVGDEVEVLEGAGAGLLAHITSITGTTTFTVTLDEAYAQYTAGDAGVAVFRNWQKFATIAYGDSNASQKFLSQHLGLQGEFLQLKVELRGVGVKVVETLVDNVFRLPAGQ